MAVSSYLIQWEGRVTRNGEVGVERQVRDILGSRPYVGGGLDLGQAFGDEEDAVDEQAVGGTLDLEVAEEGVGAEEGEDLIEGVVAVGLGVGGLVGRQRRVGQGEGVGWAAGLGPQREEGEVPDQPWDVGVGIEYGVVGLLVVVG